jgi:hypothetical protein
LGGGVEAQILAAADVIGGASRREPLTIERYDSAEARAHVELSIPHLMAFRPVAFESVGWPTRISDERELLRYVDHNFEAEVPALYKPGAEFEPIGYRNAFTLDEQALIAAISDQVAEMTEHSFGRRTRPMTNLLVQTGPFRVMQQLATTLKRKQLNVFEVGPGAGYLGAMLAHAGHRYLSYDVVQSLYLWQSRLLQAMAGPDFVEVAGLDESEAERAVLETRVVHLPWWTYVKMLDGTHVRADVIYSNSNLSEMTHVALRHVLLISRQMLVDSPNGVFCFFSKGMPSQTPHDQLDEVFRQHGFHKAFDTPFHAFTVWPDAIRPLNNLFKRGIQAYNPSGRKDVLDAAAVVPVRRAEAPLDLQLTMTFYDWTPPLLD